MARPRARTLCVLLLLTLLLAIAPAPGALAQATLTTTWPAVEVEPGAQVTVPLDVEAPGRQLVSLDLVEVPDGWDAILRGGGFVVHAVTPDDDGTRVDLQLTVPRDASEGVHRVVVAATAGGVVDQLAIELIVAAEVVGAVTLETEFPVLSGAADDTFRWSLELANTLPGETTFALQASGPPGWIVSARPGSETRATTVTLEGGDTETVQVSAEPPVNAQQGEHEFVVVATGGGQRVEARLVAEVEGVAGIRLTTADERLNASGTAGRASRVELIVTNTGSTTLGDVSLRADPPTGWEVTFEPDDLGPIAPGESAEVTAVVVPADDAITGDYALGLRAEAEGRDSHVEVRFQVRTPVGWGVVGVAIILVAVAGLAFVFRRYGRR